MSTNQKIYQKKIFLQNQFTPTHTQREIWKCFFFFFKKGLRVSICEFQFFRLFVCLNFIQWFCFLLNSRKESKELNFVLFCWSYYYSVLGKFFVLAFCLRGFSLFWKIWFFFLFVCFAFCKSCFAFIFQFNSIQFHCYDFNSNWLIWLTKTKSNQKKEKKKTIFKMEKKKFWLTLDTHISQVSKIVMLHWKMITRDLSLLRMSY